LDSWKVVQLINATSNDYSSGVVEAMSLGNNSVTLTAMKLDLGTGPGEQFLKRTFGREPSIGFHEDNQSALEESASLGNKNSPVVHSSNGDVVIGRCDGRQTTNRDELTLILLDFLRARKPSILIFHGLPKEVEVGGGGQPALELT